MSDEKKKEKRSAEQILAVLEDEAEHDRATDEVLAMSDEDVEREIAERRRRERPAARPRVLTAWLVAAALATLAGGGIAASIAWRDEPAPPREAPDAAPPPSMLAVEDAGERPRIVLPEDAGPEDRGLASPPPSR